LDISVAAAVGVAVAGSAGLAAGGAPVCCAAIGGTAPAAVFFL